MWYSLTKNMNSCIKVFNMKKFLFLFVCMLWQLGAWAQFSGSGNGTAEDPYRIYTDIHLAQMANFLNQQGVVFELMKDIDLTDYIAENSPAEGWMPIGVESTPFKGVLKGNGHTLSGLYINRPNTNHVGLFGYGNGITVDGLNIEATTITGRQYVAPLCGTLYGSCSIANCNVSVQQATAYCDLGGIVGFMHEGRTINNCHVSGKFETLDLASFEWGTIGGIGGSIYETTITNSSFRGDVKGERKAAGGIVGSANHTSFVSCSSYGTVSGVTYVGGLCGSSFNYCDFTNSAAKMNITATDDYSGGVVGYIGGVGLNSMNGCSFFGDINGKNRVGGLIGGNVNEASSSRSKSVGGTYHTIIKNCVAIGNINGGYSVGGLIGKNVIVKAYRYNPNNYDYEDIRVYDIEDCYYSGVLSGTESVGGLFGWTEAGSASRNYCYSPSISGTTAVGGIAGYAQGYTGKTSNTITFKSNVAINSVISATVSDAGRIYGKLGNERVAVGAMSSPESNRALTQTSVMLCGVAQDVLDNEQNGTSVGPSMLRLKANYVSWGWNFDNDWNILETECYPYKKYQAAPPVIESNLESQATSISGSSLNGGTVYLYYKDRDAVSTTANEHAWSFATEPLQSGAQVQLYADVEGMTPSYFSSAMVKYPGSGTEADPYRIYTAEDLQGASNSGYYKLMNDIDLAQWIRENSPTTGWKPIGRNSTVATYINGDGHKVTGLWTNTTDNYTGLFSNYSAGYIKNLTVEVASGKKVKGGDFTGILIGRIANAQIINCSVKGDAESADKILGGVAGAAYNTQISHVNYEGTVTSTSNGRYTGGLVGYVSNSNISNCGVYATISASNVNGEYYDLGGLLGALDDSSLEKSRANVKMTESGSLASGTAAGLVGSTNVGSKISACYTSGTIVANVETQADFSTGGLVGRAYSPISDSYSTADVTGTQFTGGLVGYTYSTITNCYAKGNVNGVMYGAGLVGELDGADAAANGVVAANNRLDLTAQSSWGCRVIGGFKNGCAEPALGKNYALNTMQVSLNGVAQKKTDDNIEGVAKTAAELMSSATYTALGWDFEKVWGIDEGKMYPFLLWEVDVNPVVEITLDKTTAVVAAGNTLTLTPNIQPLGATNKRLAWTSSNEGVATVEDGVVTAIAIGEATITATATDGSGVSAQCKVTVVANHDEAINQLRDDVDAALALYNNSTEGSNIGQYAAGSRAALLKVINEVRALISDTMDETAISNCSSKLAKAVADFKAQKVTGGADTDITLLDNVVYIEPVQSGTGRQLTLSVKMKNNKAFTGYKFDLYLPGGCTFATDEDGFPLAALSLERTTTAKTNYFDSSILGDGEFLRVLCYSSKGYAFTGEDGEIATVTIDIPADMEAGDYALVLKDIELAVGDESYDTDYVKSTLSVTTYKLGDANDDGKIGVADLTAIASHILGTTPIHFVQGAADANEDGKIGVADLTCIAGWILNGTANSQRRAQQQINAEGLSISLDNFNIIPGETALVAVNIANPGAAFAGYQFDIVLPEGLRVVDAAMSTQRHDERSMMFEAAQMDDNTYRVLCYSTRNTVFEGNDGAVALLTIAADNNLPSGYYNAEIADAAVSLYGTSITPACKSAVVAVDMVTGIHDIMQGDNANKIYDLNGRSVNGAKLSKGVYIVNGQKIVK